MVLTETKLANVMGGKTARACDNCIRKRARCSLSKPFGVWSPKGSFFEAIFSRYSHCNMAQREFENLSTPDESEAPFDINNFNGLTLPSELELAEFAADVESLLGKSLDEEPFDIESLGMVDCRLESLDDVVKVEEEVHCEAVNSELDMMREPFELNFDYDSAVAWEEEDGMCVVKNESEKCEVVCDDQMIFHTEKGIKIKKMLKLDYEGIIGAWDDDRSPWISGDRPELDRNDCWLDCMGGCGKMEHYHCGDMGMMMWNSNRLDGGREARVSRYKEKRRTRLFSKKIRYEK
uniref:Zinc finger protein CONSTANS-LIKE 16-like n=1 Tax=Tanacetum cinerariifolium TaxID=118510 RepID=A0A6L2NDE8_TANCI|nr:zinc finger protein CONSTANS-LIKE 16-like [Tanacetum cinerariifolium]